MNEHLLKRFDEELNKLRFRLVKMGTLVQEQLEMAIRAINESNLEFAKLVFVLEEKVDNLDIKIDKQCQRIFALHQPVAMDLRLVLAAVAMNDHFEFLGDIAASIANNVSKNHITKELIDKTKFKEETQLIMSMILNLMDSFVYMNNDLAITTIKKSVEIHKFHNYNDSILLDIAKTDNSQIEACFLMSDINRNLQIIARQIKSIAEELVFLFEARMIKHSKLDDENILNNEIEEEPKV